MTILPVRTARALRESNIHWAWIVTGVLCVVGSAYLVVWVPVFARQAPAARVGLTAALAILVFVLLTALALLAPRRDWFHPGGFPVAYSSLVLLGPVAYVLATGHLGRDLTASDVTSTVLLSFVLFVAGLTLGCRVRRRSHSLGPVARPVGETGFDYVFFRALGRSILVVISLVRVWEFYNTFGQPYGLGSLGYNFDRWLKIAGDVLVLVAVVFIVVGNVCLHRKVARTTDVVLFGLFAISTLATGSRGELIAPLIFTVWAYHTGVKAIGIGRLAVATTLVVVVFTAVGAYRAESNSTVSSEPASDRALVSVSTPLFITERVTQLVPNIHPYFGGSTYTAALARQLPGPIARRLFGPPGDTGAYVFRQLLGFENPNAGFGFAISAEAYLNFGLQGCFVVGLLVGLLLSVGYLMARWPPTKARHLFYGLVIATLPYAIRSDALAQIKSVLYPMLILAAGAAAARRRGRHAVATQMVRRAPPSHAEPLGARGG
jgi:oligosaccharide repeat unit polymerase